MSFVGSYALRGPARTDGDERQVCFVAFVTCGLYVESCYMVEWLVVFF